MALLNQSCIVHYDKNGCISRFILSEYKVYHTVWGADSKIFRNDVVAKEIEEIKCCSDGGRRFFLFCLNVSGDIEIYAFEGANIYHSKLRTAAQNLIIRDFTPYAADRRCELLISHSKPENRNERILTKYTITVADIMCGDEDSAFQTRDLMEYETFGPVDEIAVTADEEEGSVISVIEKSEEANSVILLKDNRFGYVEGLIKICMNSDIFWHDIFAESERIVLVFTVRDENFFTIKLICYDRKLHKLSDETIIREKAACSHPAIVKYMGKLWICWYENGAVCSTALNDEFKTENPVKYKDSASKKVMYTSFVLDCEQIRKKYDFGCRKVFITYPDNNMTGFGTV